MKSIAKQYLKDLYDIGAISTDVYEITLQEDVNTLLSFDNIGNEVDIKNRVIDYLYDIGGVSTDVYYIEKENL